MAVLVVLDRRLDGRLAGALPLAMLRLQQQKRHS
jgi:hypothetical protein